MAASLEYAKTPAIAATTYARDRRSLTPRWLTDRALSCAPRVKGNDTSGWRPANRPQSGRPMAGKPGMTEWWRRVSCSAVLGGAPQTRDQDVRVDSAARPSMPRGEHTEAQTEEHRRTRFVHERDAEERISGRG